MVIITNNMEDFTVLKTLSTFKIFNTVHKGLEDEHCRVK